jgi:hypothetical protein
MCRLLDVMFRVLLLVRYHEAGYSSYISIINKTQMSLLFSLL